MGDSDEQRPKRQKRDSSYKAKAFEKFKDIKSGKRNKYADEEIENVYDIVEESEYIKKVVDRQDDDWIVDDDGSGYVEDGRDVFDDDLDIESINAAASTSRGKKRKKKSLTDGKSSGKGKLRYMLSNMPTKKKEETNLNNDDVLSELLEEIDETPNTHQIIKPKPITSGFSTILASKKAEKEYIRTLAVNNSNSNKRVEIVDKPKVLKQVLHSNFDSVEKNDDHLQETNDDNIEQENTTAITVQDDCFNDDLDMTQIDELNTTVDDANVDNKRQNVDDDDVVENWFSNDFQMPNLDDNIETTPVINDDDDEDDKTDRFRFYWLDAYEDSNKQPGVVFLFGKTWDDQNKNYSSCCVVVREIERKIYFLPKPFVNYSSLYKDADTGDEITSQDVYKEINEAIMKPRQVKHFKARPIAKKYAFEAGIPTESDYIEVRYSARDPAVSSTMQGRTFSRVFGTESSYLEILLLERKIKGPCWLDITNFTKTINPISWCKIEIDCCKLNDINITNYKEKTPPPLIVASINMRRCINPKTLKNEIVMLSCVINQKYFVDKPVPSVPFQKHFCVFTSPNQQMFPMDLHTVLNTFKGTTVQKVDTEKALLNYFIIQLSKIDCDLIVGHDLIGYQMNIISERLYNYELYNNFSKLSRLKRTTLIQKKLERELFLGRLVCDIKQTTKELIKCRSYDLNALCETVLKLNENQRIDLELDDIPKMFQTSNDIIKLIQLTMQDTLYIMKIMYQLNMIPLAIQITNICGNILSKTLLGGRSERNEYLLLHAFYEKNYIVPDKLYNNYNKKDGEKVASSKKKPSYSGGLVLEPKVGFYDKLVLLMDFNSLYPSIIQEYNICFTTIPIDLNEDNVVLPASNLPSGILPTEIRKLVDSRRQVKQLMNMPDLNNDLKQQYNIRQMALKLTANSMYGCLGFTNSRFYAKNLAALITFKGREILTNTRDVVEKMNYNVLYGDTDSLMILTNIIDYDGVFKIGNKIKQEVNKLYKQIELDIDGVFKCLLLLKKKKYAAINLTKTPQNELKQTIEYKGLDIVRRDWSQLASQAGKFVLKQIFNDTITLDERIDVIMQYLKKLKDDAQENTIPLSLLIITKQLTKNPELYNDKNAQPHVQVALRYNKDYGGHLRCGDTVPYIICDDGTNKSSTQRAYHIEELKNNPSLKIDNNYYLSQQIYPVITRICEPIDGIDVGQIADALGLDITKKLQHQQQQQHVNIIGENITRPEIKFRNVDQFSFKCVNCQFVNTIDGPLEYLPNVPFEKCLNSDCNARPLDYSTNIQNQLIQTINSYIDKYYQYEMYCEDPMCTNETTRLPLNFSGRFPLCTLCNDGVLLKKYTETNLYLQLSYFQYIFDLNKLNKKLILDQQVEKFYNVLKETVDKRLNYCAFSIINLDQLFSGFKLTDKDYTFVPDNEDSDVDE